MVKGEVRRSEESTLFSVDVAPNLAHQLDSLRWPEQARFPVNRASAHVRDVLLGDLALSDSFLAVVGYSSIGELIELISVWSAITGRGGPARLLFGTEPFASTAKNFSSPRSSFTAEATEHWLDRGVSLRLSAKVVHAIELVEAGAVSARFLAGQSPLHAKIYVGHEAATIGSSNFTRNGLGQQIEGNVRFERVGRDAKRFEELSLVASNFWALGEDWNEELLALLRMLLRVVSWQEALARACAELLEGDWAGRYVRTDAAEVQALWPSQRAGIAQALWIIENVGSVLVADATGSGKTRMGAHLVRAIRDRLWSTGRIRRDITALVCPPSVLDVWREEGITAGVQIQPVSHGILSRSGSDGPSIDQRVVRSAQLLAVDEAHNFLNSGSNRTRTLRENLADHVMLFTATPISRGAGDLLDLVALLGPDNFEDSTLEVLDRLERVGGASTASMTPDEISLLRSEIARFTLRRTKSQINQLVDRDAQAYRHPVTGRTCRYPEHHACVYVTAETPADESAASRIREISDQLTGIALLPRTVAVPAWMRSRMSDESWLKFRLSSASGLAQHQVRGSLRSSRAAVYEHVRGTDGAMKQFELAASFKTAKAPGVISKLRQLALGGPPDVSPLDCEVPDWMTDQDLWVVACGEEEQRYELVGEQVLLISDAREVGKAELLTRLADEHERVLAFDHHLITLSVIEQLLEGVPGSVIVATGQNKQNRKKVMQQFAPGGSGRAIALCSDAMNEGVNLQGASVIVHLDLPTTLRVAEQRVGRVDRMDSRHDAIEAWWPSDGPAFATRANEKLARRVEESESLLGGNLTVPELSRDRSDEIVSIESQIEEFETTELADWDGIRDALEPIRDLVTSDDALIGADIYEHYRHVDARVMSYVTPLRSESRWAFLSVRATAHGAPRWMLIEPGRATECEFDIGRISDRLRELLGDDPPSRALDERATEWLDQVLDEAAREEHRMLPRRMQRALDQMRDVVSLWADEAGVSGHWELHRRWSSIAAVALPATGESEPDPYAVAERWLTLVVPMLEEHRQQQRRSKYTLLKDITGRLRANPLDIDEVEAHFSGVPVAAPLAERVSACIVGVPEV